MPTHGQAPHTIFIWKCRNLVDKYTGLADVLAYILLLESDVGNGWTGNQDKLILWGFWEAGKSFHHAIAIYDLFITFEELCHAAVWGTYRMFKLVAQQLLTSITWPEGPESLDDMSHKGTFRSENQ